MILDAMENIEIIKDKAKTGDVQSQIELAHAYLNGKGVAKNRAHYLKWLTKAAEQNNVDAQYELFQFYSSKSGKYTDMQAACHWAERAKANGMAFTEEELLKVGDADSCEIKINEYLFGEKIQFEKAKSLMLKSNLSKETLLSLAERFGEKHLSNGKRLSQIYYLYLISTSGDTETINSLAINLTEKSKRNYQKISADLFREAYQKGNKYAAASYMYCLIHGKGVKKDIALASRIYFEYKSKGITLSHAFANESIKGVSIKLPTSITWEMGKLMLTIDKTLDSVLGNATKPFHNLFSLTGEYWSNKVSESIRMEEDAIAEEVSKGNYAAADGCKDNGCTLQLIDILNSLMGVIGIIGIVIAIILGMINEHIPTWLLSTVCVTFFFPSFYGIEGKVTRTLTFLSPLVILGLIFLNLLDWDISNISNISTIFKDLSITSIIWKLVGYAILIVGLVYIWFFSNLFMGYWFQYVAAIEWKYGSFKALIFTVVSLAITLGVGFLLYQHEVIF